MSRVAYLCSKNTHPSSLNRRSDAYEHDRMMAVLKPAFVSQSMLIEDVCWDNEQTRWQEYDAAIIGTTWDYWDRSEQYLETLEFIESKTRLFNSAEMVKWNSDKQYLKVLESSGSRLIPTKWISDPTEESIANAFEFLGCEDMVLKRQIGAGAAGQYRLHVSDSYPQLDRPMMAQPFLPEIETYGELSFIYIDGQFCHALVKRPKLGDYRIQSSFGGTEEKIDPSDSDLKCAGQVVAALDTIPLYARVDMLRANDGGLFLMELELIEPYLYPLEGPELGNRIALAVKKRL